MAGDAGTCTGCRTWCEPSSACRPAARCGAEDVRVAGSRCRGCGCRHTATTTCRHRRDSHSLTGGLSVAAVPWQFAGALAVPSTPVRPEMRRVERAGRVVEVAVRGAAVGRAAAAADALEQVQPGVGHRLDGVRRVTRVGDRLGVVLFDVLHAAAAAWGRRCQPGTPCGCPNPPAEAAGRSCARRAADRGPDGRRCSCRWRSAGLGRSSATAFVVTVVPAAESIARLSVPTVMLSKLALLLVLGADDAREKLTVPQPGCRRRSARPRVVVSALSSL